MTTPEQTGMLNDWLYLLQVNMQPHLNCTVRPSPAYERYASCCHVAIMITGDCTHAPASQSLASPVHSQVRWASKRVSSKAFIVRICLYQSNVFEHCWLCLTRTWLDWQHKETSASISISKTKHGSLYLIYPELVIMPNTSLHIPLVSYINFLCLHRSDGRLRPGSSGHIAYGELMI